MKRTVDLEAARSRRQPDWPEAGQVWINKDLGRVVVLACALHENGKWVVSYRTGDGLAHACHIERWFQLEFGRHKKPQPRFRRFRESTTV